MRTNLIVPYVDKDKAKSLGAKWDMNLRMWYVEDAENLEDFLEWMPEHLKKSFTPPTFARRDPYREDTDDVLRNALEGCAEALDVARVYADMSIIPKLNIATRLIDDALKLLEKNNP